MKILALSLVFLLIAGRLAWHRNEREKRWAGCYQCPEPQPVVFNAEVTTEGGRYRLGVSPDPRFPWLPEELKVSPLGKPAVLSPEIGRPYRITGRLFCRPPHRNPSLFPRANFQEAPSWHFSMATLTPDEGGISFRTALLEAFFTPLSGFPRLHALAQATWSGETVFESPLVIHFFRDSGLLAILALSGEHVAIFLVGVEAAAALLFRKLFSAFPAGRPAKALKSFALGWRRFRLLGGASLLLWTSGGLPSMKRTWWMALFYCALKCRSLRTSALQLVASSFAFVLAWDPSLALSPGFLLSAWGTFALFHVSETYPGEKTWGAAILLSFLIPILTLPWTAHLFSKVAVGGVLAGGVGGALWATLFLPVGFLSPIFAHCLPAFLFISLARWLENGLVLFEGALIRLLPYVRETVFSVVRPTFGECLAMEAILMVFVVGIVRIVAKPSDRNRSL